MLIVKNITIRNFLSVGNVTQAIDFDRSDLTLVLGENLDLGGNGSRNGVGKTAIVNALSYALYGQALTKIKQDNLINKTNNKNMLVSLDFTLDGTDYRIKRGRRPAVLKFFVNNHEQVVTNDSQGDSRETQDEIERLLGMSHDMFRHIVALNTYTEPFLSLKAGDQRTIIEQLLGITLLSEKAERIKELARATREAITGEELRIRAIQEANKMIEEQIQSLRRRQSLWLRNRDEDCQKLREGIEALEHIDIEQEVQSHRDLELFHSKQKILSECQRWIRQIDQDNNRLERDEARLTQEISSLEQHLCHACGQTVHNAKQEEILQSKRQQLQEIALQIMANLTQHQTHSSKILELGELGAAPTVFYDNLEQALNHRNSLDQLRQNLESRSREEDPYEEQIVSMQGRALQEINYDTINELKRTQEHQDFLLKLLTNKDSFVRKKIIDQNLNYLNTRLEHYLENIGLPHQVVFQNDLTVDITELGRDLDFDNLSRGERNRLVLSMSWAFRDVWESLYRPINVLFIDELIDSGLDGQGVENSLALLKKMSRDRNKSIWLVSHREELIGRVNNILTVIKENGFTSFGSNEDVV